MIFKEFNLLKTIFVDLIIRKYINLLKIDWIKGLII